MHPTPRHLALLPLLFLTPLAYATPDLRFDVATFNATPEGSPDHMNQTLFNDLNFPDQSGHYLGMGSDAHRPEISAAGNALASYYNSWTNIYNAQPTTAKDGSAAADSIAAYVNAFTTNGPRPNWVVLNELSGSLWPNNPTYRQWTIDCVTKLHDTYGLNVLAYSPFPNPVNNSDSWAALSAKAYIGIEYYLSGAEVKAQNFSLPWVQSQYQSAINSYAARGVPKDHMILGEEFASTNAGTGYGRDGVSQSDWDATIRVRSQAIYNLDFAGFIGYAWGKNAMALSDADLLDAEDTYRSTMVLHSESPQWLSPTGGSWNTRNNWLAYDTIPNAPGAIATFDKSLTTPTATITLDGPKTVGSLTLNTPHPLTLSPGTGGTLTLQSSTPTPPSISVLQGSHTITAPLVFSSPATLTISPGATLDITTNTLSLSADPAAIRQYLSTQQLLSSTANADPQHDLALAYLQNPDSSITVKTTFVGDANCDGVINADDYALLDKGFATHASTWQLGDFNYDGTVNAADYLLLDRTLTLLSGSLSPDPSLLSERESQFGDAYVQALLTSIPEPSRLLPSVTLLLAALSRRKPLVARPRS